MTATPEPADGPTICGSVGPRIGSSGTPRCAQKRGHEGPCRGFDGSGFEAETWTDPGAPDETFVAEWEARQTPPVDAGERTGPLGLSEPTHLSIHWLADTTENVVVRWRVSGEKREAIVHKSHPIANPNDPSHVAAVAEWPQGPTESEAP